MIAFSINEGWRNLRNLGIYGLLTIVSLTLTLTILGISTSGFKVIKAWRSGLLGRFEIEAFLYTDIDTVQTAVLLEGIRHLESVDEVRYISRDMAVKKFSEQFGPELFELIEYNPLPASFVIKLAADADPSESWKTTSEAVQNMKGIEDVVYQGELLASVDRFYRRGGVIAVIAVTLMMLVSLLFTVMTVVGVIKSRQGFIRVIALSGGSRLMACGPFVVMGIYFGLISSTIAAMIVYIIDWVVSVVLGLPISLTLDWALVVYIAGILVGVSGSGWAAWRHIRMC